MALTQQQLQENIKALEKQGAPKEKVQGYLNTLKKNTDGTYEPKAATKPKTGISKVLDGVKKYAK